nr:Uncharacterised protein [Klebsiella pneumoniae]
MRKPEYCINSHYCAILPARRYCFLRSVEACSTNSVMERKGPPPRSGQTGLSRARYRGPDISVLFASRFTRATAARRFAVLSARFGASPS